MLPEKGIWAKHTLWEESTRIPMIIRRPSDGATSATKTEPKSFMITVRTLTSGEI